MSFGFLFDIDGVFLKGKNVLPQAVKALKLLTNDKGKWKVPVIFVTNAGNSLKKVKAERLSNQLQVNIDPEQMVMAHSPFSMLEHFHNKYSLLCGQGPVKEIAQNLGFKDVITIDEYKKLFPHLDVCNHNRRKAAPCAFEQFQRRIESVILFGESTNWETPLQLILDVLLSNGHPYRLSEIHNAFLSSEMSRRNSANYPHIPVLACNMDLIWMSDAPSPRFAHGSFLHALEAMYKKFSGNKLLYTTLVGKPSELTYHHAISKLNYISNLMFSGKLIRKVYCIGDNPNTDIYGANLYNRYLKSRKSNEIECLAKKIIDSDTKINPSLHKNKLNRTERIYNPSLDSFYQLSDSIQENLTKTYLEQQIDPLESILVLTGVYRDQITMDKSHVPSLIHSNSFINYNHRDFPDHPELKIPNHLAKDIHEAVKYAYDKEKFEYEEL